MSPLFQKIAEGVIAKNANNKTRFGQFMVSIMRKKLGQSAPAAPNQRRASVINQTQAADPNSTLLS